MAKGTTLMKAYVDESIPVTGGFIISGFFQSGSAYAIYEVTAYANLKDIFNDENCLTFKTDGNRTHLLVEPASFSRKHIEPVNREVGLSIPYRFSDMEIISGKKNEKIMVPNEPITLHSSFTIASRQDDFFAFIFEPSEDVYVAIKKFIADSLYNDCNLSQGDALEASKTLLSTIKKFQVWQ